MNEFELALLKEDFAYEHSISLMKMAIFTRSKFSYIAPLDLELMNKFQTISDEMLILMLDMKAKRRALKGYNYQPLFLNQKGILRFADYLADLPVEKEFQFNLIIRTEGHYTPVRIDYNGVIAKIYVVDAGSYKSNMPSIRLFREVLDAELYVHRGGIQFDTRSCCIFALQNLNIMSMMNQEELQTMLSKPYNQIECLPGKFIRHIQSQRAYNSYNSAHLGVIASKRGKLLSDYVSESSRLTFFSRELEGPRYHNINYSIIIKTEKYLSSIKTVVDNLTIDEYTRICSLRTENGIINDYLFGAVPLKTNLSGKYQIKLKEEFLLNEEDLLSSCCMDPYKGASLMVYDIIKAALATKNVADPIRAAHEKFREISDLDYNQLRLIEKGMSIYELRRAKCFSRSGNLYKDMELSKLAYQFICRSGYSNLQENFELIKDCCNVDSINSIIRAKGVSWVERLRYDNTQHFLLQGV